jgi:hypothetical protein
MVSKNLLVGMGIGAFLLFIADPGAGRRRRALSPGSVRARDSKDP